MSFCRRLLSFGNTLFPATLFDVFACSNRNEINHSTVIKTIETAKMTKAEAVKRIVKGTEVSFFKDDFISSFLNFKITNGHPHIIMLVTVMTSVTICNLCNLNYT